MKIYHFALFFLLLAGGMFVTAQVRLVDKMQNETMRRREYGCLVAAVNAVTEEVFDSEIKQVSQQELRQAETVFFQTLGVLHDGTTDVTAWESLKGRIPCLAVFDVDGYFVYQYESGEGQRWSEEFCYEDGIIPEHFFEETEALLEEYLKRNGEFSKKYRMEPAGKSVWEQSLEPPCVFAIYAPPFTKRIAENADTFLYAGTGVGRMAYYVTENQVCHYSDCEEVGNKKVVGYYAVQKDCAKAGAVPCEKCMK